MSGTSPSTPLPVSGGDDRGGGRPRRWIAWLGGVALLAVAALAAAALIPGSHASGDDGLARTSVVARSSAANRLHVRQDKVFGSEIPARDYGTRIADQEQGLDTSGQLTSDLSPLPPRSFHRPVAEYRAYAIRWMATLGHDVAPLTAALRAGDRGAAKRAWSTAFSDYLHLGAVYNLLPGDLNDRLAGLPPQIGSRRFVGLHRIEMGLWTGERVRSLAPLATQLSDTVTTVHHALSTVAIDPLDYATRAHEILEDAQRDLMSGTQVPWSGEGVLGTAAGVAVTRKVMTTLVPLLSGRDNTLGTSQYWLLALNRTLNGVRRPDGTYPTLGQLSPAKRQLINGTLAGTLSALQDVPGTLETTQIPDIPKLPVPK